MKLLIVWFAFISVISVCITVRDKAAARRRKTRVPESFLICLAISGGSLAMFIAMKTVRHKTTRRKFMLGLPFIAAVQIFIVVISAYLYNYL